MKIKVKSDFFEIRFLGLKINAPLYINLTAFICAIISAIIIAHIFFQYGPFLLKIISLVEKIHLIYIATLYFFYKSLTHNKRNFKFLKELKLQNHKAINNYTRSLRLLADCSKIKELSNLTLLFKI